MNDSFFDSFSNISNDCLSQILDSEQSSLESYFLAAKLIKKKGLESSNNPFIDDLLSILEKKPTIWHKTTQEKLTRIFSKSLFDHLLLNASASNPEECGKSFFLNCLYLNKIFSINHVESSYGHGYTIGGQPYYDSFKTKPLSLSELQDGSLEAIRNNSPFFRGNIAFSQCHLFKININSNEYFFEFSSEDEVIHLSNILLMNPELQKSTNDDVLSEINDDDDLIEENRLELSNILKKRSRQDNSVWEISKIARCTLDPELNKSTDSACVLKG